MRLLLCAVASLLVLRSTVPPVSVSVVCDHQEVTGLVRYDCAMLSERRVLYQRVKNPYSVVSKCPKVIQFFVSLCVKTGKTVLVDLTWEKGKISSKMEKVSAVS